MKILVFFTALTALFSNLETKTLQSDISLTMQVQGQAALTTPGKFVMHGEKFKGTARGYEVAYDGKTFYLYDPDTEELTLSYPSKDELVSTNPLLYARSLCEVSNVKESVNKDGTVTTIVLVPKGTPDKQMKVTVKVKGNTPLSVEIKEPQSTTTLRLKNAQYISTTPDFTIVKKDVYINDLR